jgi:hypothetical protein
MIFTKGPAAKTWHVQMQNLRTVCGLSLITGSARVTRKARKFFGDGQLCKSCDRMKDADTVKGQLA